VTVRVCVGWLVGWLVRSLRSLSFYFSKTTSPIFVKFDTGVYYLRQISLLAFQRSRSKFEVKTALVKIS